MCYCSAFYLALRIFQHDHRAYGVDNRDTGKNGKRGQLTGIFVQFAHVPQKPVYEHYLPAYYPAYARRRKNDADKRADDAENSVKSHCRDSSRAQRFSLKSEKQQIRGTDRYNAAQRRDHAPCRSGSPRYDKPAPADKMFRFFTVIFSERERIGRRDVLINEYQQTADRTDKCGY